MNLYKSISALPGLSAIGKGITAAKSRSKKEL